MGCRKNQATLTLAEKTAYVNAVLALKQTVASRLHPGDPSRHRYDDYVEVHMNAMMLADGSFRVPGWAHRGPAFGPWHREMLLQFELDLQAIDPTVTIPYWDWTVNNSPDPVAGSPWTDDFMGKMDPTTDQVTSGPFRAGTWHKVVFEPGDSDPSLRRALGRGAFQPAGAPFPVTTLPTSSNVTTNPGAALTVTPYDAANWNEAAQPSFRNRLEGWYGAGSIHNRVHLWVAGSMLPSTSPNDPIFFLHHCNVDRLWAMWQQQHPLEDYHPTGLNGEAGPPGHNLNDVMIFHDAAQPAPWSGSATASSVLDHHALGYWYDTDVPQVTLVTPSLDFGGIPAGMGATGVTTYRGIKFEVQSCNDVTLQIVAGPTAGFAAPTLSALVPVNQGPLAGLAPNLGRLWIAYTSTTPGSSITGSVTVQAVDGGTGTVLGPWVINLAAQTIPRPTSAVMLVLDRSGSMTTDAGNGHQRVELLRTAVATFVDVMQAGDGLGIVRFDNLVDTVMPVTDVGAVAGGAGRSQADAIVTTHDPATSLDPRGSTSIGGGIQQAKTALDGAAGSYTTRAMVVLTDGLENTAPMIADVGASLSANTFAIGFGHAASISTAALNAITQGHGGYLVVTGPITPDETFALTEYFLKIQAGITNAAAVLDPRGELIYGVTHRIPFTLTSADMSVDVVLLSQAPYYIDFRLEAPDGTIVQPATTSSEPAITFVSTSRVSYYRAALPMIAAQPHGSHAGQWHVLLSLSERARVADAEFVRGLKSRSLPYSLLVHTASNLQFKASVVQHSFEPGAEVRMLVTLQQYDVPLEKRATVWAEIRRPDGSESMVALVETDPGRFAAGLTATQVGVYTLRVRAHGLTFEGQTFKREQRLTAVVFPGGDQPPQRSSDDGLCKLLECVLSSRVLHGDLVKLLAAKGVNLQALEECLELHCRTTSVGLGGEQPYSPTNTPGRLTSDIDIAHLLAQPGVRQALSALQREVTATQGTLGFAELQAGTPVHYEAGPMPMLQGGLMFDLSPEDKAVGEPARDSLSIAPQTRPVADDARNELPHVPTVQFDLSPEDKAADAAARDQGGGAAPRNDPEHGRPDQPAVPARTGNRRSKGKS